jgi:hypothetical protein
LYCATGRDALIVFKYDTVCLPDFPDDTARYWLTMINV